MGEGNGAGLRGFKGILNLSSRVLVCTVLLSLSNLANKLFHLHSSLFKLSIVNLCKAISAKQYFWPPSTILCLPKPVGLLADSLPWLLNQHPHQHPQILKPEPLIPVALVC